MTSGQQRKRAQIKQYHKIRHIPPPSSSSQHHQHTQPLPPPLPSSATTNNIYHESPHKYLTTSSSSLEPQHHVFSRTKKYPSSSDLLQIHENGQLLSTDADDIYSHGDIEGDVGGGGGSDGVSSSLILSTDTDVTEPMMIPSYLAKNFALFPQPTTTYETEIIPHTSQGFSAVVKGLGGVEEALEEDNEITKHKGKGLAGSLDSFTHENYQRHKPSSYSSIFSTTSGKNIKNEQLLQQLLQQQYNSNSNEKPEIMNTAAYKSNKLPKASGGKYRAEKDYHSDGDMMYSSKYNPAATTHNNFNRPEEDVAYSGNIKTLTVDDIWSQLQQQYLSKYSPQAQTITTSVENEEPQQTLIFSKPKIKPKHKRNTKRPRINRPNISSFTSSWPVKTLSFGSSSSGSNSKHHKQQQHQHKQPQQHHYNEDLLASLPSAAAFNSGRLTQHRDTDLFAKRPINKFTATNYDESDDDDNEEDDISEINDDNRAVGYGEDNEDDELDVFGDNADNSHDESFEDAVYQQRGKKFTGHTAYGQRSSHTNNPFNYHDLYGSYSTPVTATIATNIQPSTYHPNNLVSSTLPAYTTSASGGSSSSTSSFLKALSQHPSTSYQWRTQQNYPASYQTYHLQHQQQQPQRTSQTAATTTAETVVVGVREGSRNGDEQYAPHLAKQQQQQSYNNAALRLSKSAITQTPNTITTSQFSPTQSNDFIVTSSSSTSFLDTSPTDILSSAKSTVQPSSPSASRYKKRKNRIKTKRNRIVVI